MPDLSTYAMAEQASDLGWAVRNGLAYEGFAALAPDATHVALWSLYNGGVTLLVEAFRITSDTAMTITVGYMGSGAGFPVATSRNRLINGGTAGSAWGGGTGTLPMNIGTIFTQPVQANTPIDLFMGVWYAIQTGYSLVVYTPTVAANITGICCWRAF